jgi:fructoselysine/glucoselysine PTS system EIIA component
MRRIVLASHGHLAAGMKNSLEMITGPNPNVLAICAYTDGAPDLAKALQESVDRLEDDDDLVIVTDVLGGSVNNEASQFRNVKRVYVVTGMNLGFVLTLALGSDDNTPALIEEAIDIAKGQLVRMEPVEDKDDEDF